MRSPSRDPSPHNVRGVMAWLLTVVNKDLFECSEAVCLLSTMLTRQMCFICAVLCAKTCTYGPAKSLEEIVWFLSFAVKTTFIVVNLIANVNYAKIPSYACASRVAVVFSDALFVPSEKKRHWTPGNLRVALLPPSLRRLTDISDMSELHLTLRWPAGSR